MPGANGGEGYPAGENGVAQVAYDRAYVADLVDKALRRVRMFLVGLRGEQR